MNRRKIRRNEPCPCGSGDKYKRCHGKESQPSNPTPQRSSPVRGSLRVELVDPPPLAEPVGTREVEPRPLDERNKLLVDAIDEIFGPLEKNHWDRIKKGIQPLEIRRLYEAVGAIWPPNTDLAGSLPTNNRLRGLYLGDFEREMIVNNVFRMALYTDEILVVNPFHLPHRAHGQFSPIDNPGAFKADTVKVLYAVRMLRPLIEMGIVNFIPSPGDFDPELEADFLKQAERRIGDGPVPKEMLKEHDKSQRADLQRILYSLPESHRIAEIRRIMPHLSEREVRETSEYMENEIRQDPAAYEGSVIEGGGQFQGVRCGFNLETAVYICSQAGAFPYTSLQWKWKEILSAVETGIPGDADPWSPLTKGFQELDFRFLDKVDPSFLAELRQEHRLEGFRRFLRKVWYDIGGETDPAKQPSLARDLRDQLAFEYEAARDEWKKIDRDLVLWASSMPISAPTIAVGAGVVAVGSLLINVPALALGLTFLIKGIHSKMEQTGFRRRVPLSVFIDLDRRA